MLTSLWNNENGRDAVYHVVTGSAGVMTLHGRRGTRLREATPKRSTNSPVTRQANALVESKKSRGYHITEHHPNITHDGLVGVSAPSSATRSSKSESVAFAGPLSPDSG